MNPPDIAPSPAARFQFVHDSVDSGVVGRGWYGDVVIGWDSVADRLFAGNTRKRTSSATIRMLLTCRYRAHGAILMHEVINMV